MAETSRWATNAPPVTTQQAVYVNVDQVAVGQWLPQHRSPGTPAGLVMVVSDTGSAVLLGFGDVQAMRDLSAVLAGVADSIDPPGKAAS